MIEKQLKFDCNPPPVISHFDNRRGFLERFYTGSTLQLFHGYLLPAPQAGWIVI